MADDAKRDVSTRNTVRLVAIVVLLAILVAFVLDNTRTVEVGFVLSDKELPLIWVLVITALLGALIDRLFTWFRRRD